MRESKLEVESMPVKRTGGNGNEAVAGASSKTFTRWLHRRHASVELSSAGHIVSPRDILFYDKLKLQVVQ